MSDDIAARVAKLTHTLDKTVRRVEALRIAVIGVVASVARKDPELASKVLRDLILLLDEAAEQSKDPLYASELRELCADLRRELHAILGQEVPDGRLL